MRTYHCRPVMRQLELRSTDSAGTNREPEPGDYQYPETRELVKLVRAAADLVARKGEAAFGELAMAGSPWRQGETYIFVLDPAGNMLVHPDPEMQGKNQLDLKDLNGKAVVRGMVGAAMAFPEKPEGWYHYQWQAPGGLLPRWKSSFVKLVKDPAGNNYVVGSGMYNGRMEREFLADMVNDAVSEISKFGEVAFRLFNDPIGPFIAKDAYIFVYELDGTSLVHPPFPGLVGQNLLEMKDAQGRFPIKEMLRLVETEGAGWVEYLWPKPGEGVATRKTSYVSRATLGNRQVMVGAGVFLAGAPKTPADASQLKAPELMALVRKAAGMLAQKGEKAFPEFRVRGSEWLHDDIYLYIWSMDGFRVFHGEKPEGEGLPVSGLQDPEGRPIGKMLLEAAASPEGEGWVHALWPKPYEFFPHWKSCFVKRVTFPSGKQHLVGSGVYNLPMDKFLTEEVVNRAANLISARGPEAFPELRDKKGPFVFMNTYVFVQTPDGTELVNPAQPSLEGKNLMDLKDLKGKPVVKDEIDLALEKGSAWLKYYWYLPGSNTPAPKETFVRKAEAFGETYIVGSGYYVPEEG